MRFTEDKVRKTIQVIEQQMTKTLFEIKDITYTECGYKEFEKDKEYDFKPFDPEAFKLNTDGEAHFWFKMKVKTPEKQAHKAHYLRVVTGPLYTWDAHNPQGLIYLDEEMTQSFDINHHYVHIESGREYDAKIYFYKNGANSALNFIPQVLETDERVEALFYDMNVPYLAALEFDKDSKEHIEPIKYLSRACDLLDLRNPGDEAFFESVEKARKFLKEEFYEKVCGKSEETVYCIGHTHIDVAWLWRLRQTCEKAQRSFATVLNLMKDYPEYKFMSSQPQLYKYVEKEDPRLFEEIQKRVKEGRWEVEGAMWLEADCNLSSGESLIRQILYGKKYMKDKFGVDSRVLWLPDVFGYSAALPQILKKSGVEKFVTSKINWNETNQMPYDTFMWEGIDGTDIFSYFLTCCIAKEYKAGKFYTTYNGEVTPDHILGTYNRYQQKEYNKDTIITFGAGDGGGGPRREQLETLKRTEKGLPGVPKTKIAFAGDFLDKVEMNFEESQKFFKEMPRWVGELYLEFHRGTYTSIAKNKRNNRKSEFLWEQNETLSVMDMLKGGDYPKAEIDNAWDTILVNQFHDVIPGSSVQGVYDDSDEMYGAIFESGKKIEDEKLESLMKNVKTDGGLFVYNPNSFVTDGIVEKDGKKVYVSDIPAFGYKVVKEFKTGNEIFASKERLENDLYRIEFDENMNIKSLFDKKNNREVVQKDKVINRICVYEDFPRDYDAWELSAYYEEKMWPMDNVERVEVINRGDEAGVKITRKYGKSTVTQEILLYNGVERIDVRTEADWKESHVFVKAEFPVDVHASEATYEIQFGNLKRPTHRNTTWDDAKFEVCAHKWADISEDEYGVSILNDCKYGYSAKGNKITLSLIKCATYPYPEADKCHHECVYSILPHTGSYRHKTVKEAYALNKPLIAREIGKTEGTEKEVWSLLSCDKENVFIETVKRAENSDDIIVRLYDAFDRRGVATLKTAFDFKEVYVCDMLENELEKLETADNEVKVPVKNFEIVTLKFKR